MPRTYIESRKLSFTIPNNEHVGCVKRPSGPSTMLTQLKYFVPYGFPVFQAKVGIWWRLEWCLAVCVVVVVVDLYPMVRMVPD